MQSRNDTLSHQLKKDDSINHCLHSRAELIVVTLLVCCDKNPVPVP